MRIVIGLSLGAWSVGASSASCGGAHECSADVDFEGLSALQTASVRDSGDDAPTPAPTPSPTPSSTPARCRPARYCSEMCEALECEKSRLECEKYCRLRFDKFLDIMKRYKKYGVCEDDPVSSLAQVGAEEAADAKLEEKVERSASGEADPAVECKEVAYYAFASAAPSTTSIGLTTRIARSGAASISGPSEAFGTSTSRMESADCVTTGGGFYELAQTFVGQARTRASAGALEIA
eukprot:CAMPEP_0176267520 /NCGR_PEP_ID=MMETSP0121_2-20121125/43201_1 /TAXON_ID=160619 /ORGANISM="Kryptoperidinium foliaceum, Strain CCMP 1326" /LENGTH=235 /DNA_ID=CAMNT_0017607585 /DNA_START=74 /DNA_END=779 /DNA_ORIENTATION=-